ncbi:MAG TPA: tetratricopeptide repeat protein [Anaeromyxobacteraceae bacterium]|nr:tetratricopeptide repeat protein [Anaeromyxobacteraceae bacterium]
MEVSTGSGAALEAYERALDHLNGYSASALADADEAIARDPGFVGGHLLKASMAVMSSDLPLEGMLREAVEAAERLAPAANARERRLTAAARAWLERDFERSMRLFGDVAIDHPRDALAVQTAHAGDFLLGKQTQLRDRIAQVLHAWDEGVPGYGYVLGMYAFGLEETGDYRRAEEIGRRAVALLPHDAWAAHAVAHVLEMEARVAEGIDWIARTSAAWLPDNALAYHNHWHRALYHLDLGDAASALALLDAKIRPGRSQAAMELVDASALLWRLRLLGHDVGDRFGPLADDWAERIDDGYYAFNDVHALLAFLGAGRDAEAARLVGSLKRHAEGPGTNARVIREVGIPLACAFVAFERGDHETCVETLLAVRPVAVRFGGSNAQRDLLSLTLVEAALRGGRTSVAKAIASERMRLKPSSPLAWSFAARAAEAAGEGARATHAREQAERLRAGFLRAVVRAA